MSQSLTTRITNYLLAQAKHGDLWAIDILCEWERETEQNIGFETGRLAKIQTLQQTTDPFSPSGESEFQSGMPFPHPAVKYS